MKSFVRDEHEKDIAEIRHLVRAAFGKDDEADLVDRLRDAGALKVSMVLDADDRLVAHASASPMSWSSGTDSIVAWALAPVSVKPEVQRLGYGTEVVRATIDRCRDAGADILTVLGNPIYYGRFGFTPASQHALRNDDADYSDAFMVTEITDGALSHAHGRLRWHPAFESLGED